MSETGFSCFVPLFADVSAKRGTVGVATPGTLIQVIDANGKALEANRVGEICVKSGQVTPGYLNNEKESARLFTADGFLRSGDLGFYDESRDFFIVGRIKEMIKCEGKAERDIRHCLNLALSIGVAVSPIEIENLLLRHKEVTNAAVIGVEDEEKGSRAHGFPSH